MSQLIFVSCLIMQILRRFRIDVVACTYISYVMCVFGIKFRLKSQLSLETGYMGLDNVV